MTDLRASYTSAESLPVKLLNRVHGFGKRIDPIHIQWIPTNRCNLNCTFCSCSSRTNNLVMGPYWHKAINLFASLGTKAVTITGGGEPLLHPELPDMIELFHERGIKVGLVSNGVSLKTLPDKTWEKVTWCRVSHGDERELDGSYFRYLSSVFGLYRNVDWAMSYVVSSKPDFLNISRALLLANMVQMTHIRFVGDLLQPEKVPWNVFREYLSNCGISHTRAIIQPRQDPVAQSKCMLGYLKPLVAPDFRLYHCCGVQYAVDPMPRDLPDELCFGHASEASKIWGGLGERQKPFDVPCVRCYYQNYNDVLLSVFTEKDYEHGEFL